MTDSIITLIGCGNMGGALLRGWLAAGIKARYIVIDPHKPAITGKSVAWTKTPAANIKKSGIIVLAVKPQMMNETLKTLKPFVARDALILSIAAGRTIAGFEKAFGKSQPVIRTMPNLPAAVGKGMTVAVANKHARPAQKKIAEKLLQSVGLVEWVKNEKQLDAVTAVSGSGPAYVFYLIETVEHAAIRAGLDKKLAAALARQTVIGSAALAERSKEHAATLRKNVTSPGGTTEAALKILMNGEMQKLFDKAIAAGAKRGKELSN